VNSTLLDLARRYASIEAEVSDGLKSSGLWRLYRWFWLRALSNSLQPMWERRVRGMQLRYGCALPSTTSFEIGPGDRNTLYLFATAEVISAVGATPVLLILTLKRLISMWSKW